MGSGVLGEPPTIWVGAPLLHPCVADIKQRVDQGHGEESGSDHPVILPPTVRSNRLPGLPAGW